MTWRLCLRDCVLSVTILSVLPENAQHHLVCAVPRQRYALPKKTGWGGSSRGSMTAKAARHSEFNSEGIIPEDLQETFLKYSKCLSGKNNSSEKSEFRGPGVMPNSTKRLGIHIAACYLGNLDILLSHIACQASEIYVSLHCGYPCTLCPTQKEGIINDFEKRRVNFFLRKLRVPARLHTCTHFAIAPNGGQDAIMHMKFFSDHYYELPEIVAILKDTWKRTLIKANYGRNPVILDRFSYTLAKLQESDMEQKIGFTGLYHRYHSSARFHGQQRVVMDALYIAAKCEQPPMIKDPKLGMTSSWGVIPGGMFAVHRSRVREVPRSWFTHMAHLLMTYPPWLQGKMIVGIEHIWGPLFGCSGVDLYPRCPWSEWLQDTKTLEESLLNPVPSMPFFKYSA